MSISRYLVLLLCFFHISAIAQKKAKPNPFSEVEIQLAQLAESIVHDSLLEQRQQAFEDFEQLLKQTLEKPNSFNYPFEKVQAASILTAPDTTFRIFTWQLFVNNNTYQYGGIIQLNKPNSKPIILSDVSDEIPEYDIEYNINSTNDWYGAIYYNIKSFDSPEGKKYLLFGFDGFQLFEKRKIAEVLSFDKNRQPVFGAPVFFKEIEGYASSTKNRLYLQYSAEVAARLNYDSHLDILIHDHLIEMKGQYKGQGMTKVPDGSYEGYQLKKGQWVYVEKIFNQISEEPPRPEPVLEKKDRDIFGKLKKKKTPK